GPFGLSSPPEPLSLRARARAQAVAAPPRPPGIRLLDGRDSGLPMLGRALPDPPLLAEHLVLKAALDEFLVPGETFLDLTNRSAYYQHFDLPVPGLYAANFIAGNRRTQARMLAQFGDDPPPVVLIPPPSNFDHMTASLRS